MDVWVTRGELESRAFVRRVLSHHADVRPQDWRFELGAHGRPEIASPRARPRLRFSVSHGAGLLVCAVAEDHDVGIDVEDGSGPPPLEVARRYFARREVADLDRLAGVELGRRFFEYWTLKEAYLKALGLGLSVPLDQVCFHVHPDGRVHADTAETWSFALLALSGASIGAVAVRAAAPIVEVHRVGT